MASAKTVGRRREGAVGGRREGALSWSWIQARWRGAVARYRMLRYVQQMALFCTKLMVKNRVIPVTGMVKKMVLPVTGVTSI